MIDILREVQKSIGRHCIDESHQRVPEHYFDHEVTQSSPLQFQSLQIWIAGVFVKPKSSFKGSKNVSWSGLRLEIISQWLALNAIYNH